MSKLDKNFKCPGSLKAMLAGQPNAIKKLLMEAHATFVSNKKKPTPKQSRNAED